MAKTSSSSRTASSAVAGLLPILCVLLLELLLVTVCAQPEPGEAPRTDVSVVVLSKVHIRGYKRMYNGAVNKWLDDIRLDLFDEWPLLREKANLDGSMQFIKDLSPPVVLELFCQTVFKANTSVIIYIQSDQDLTQSKLSSQYAFEIASFLGIPVIMWMVDNDMSLQPTADSLFMRLTPSIIDECHAMLSILHRYNWRDFSIVTTSLSGHELFISTLRDAIETQDTRYEILTVITIASMATSVIETQLQKLRATDTRVILFYASHDDADVIFEVAARKGLTGKEFVWIVTNSIVNDVAPSAEASYPPGLLGLHYQNILDRQVDFAIPAALNVWARGLTRMFGDMENNTSPRNISLQPGLDCDRPDTMKRWPGGEILMKYMRQIHDEEHDLEFTPSGMRRNPELELYNLNLERRWSSIGLWKASEGLKITDITWPGDELTPPKGRPAKYQLKVVTLDEKPYVVFSDPDPKTGTCPPQAHLCRVRPVNETEQFPNATMNAKLYQCCSGFCIDLLRMLGEKIGFEYELFKVEDGKWGAYDTEKKEWNGLVRSIMDGKADMVITSLKITPERNEKIDFSIPFLETGITIIVAVRDGVISPTAFLEPFDIISWLFILVMSIQVVSVTIFVFEWLSPLGFDRKRRPNSEPYDYPSWCLILVFSVHASGAAIFIFEWLSPSGLDQGNKPIREHRFSLFRSFWLIWAMLFGAAVNVDNPRGVSSRFLANIWALFAVVFTASYTANLAAFMITKEDYDRLTGIRDGRLLNPTSLKPPFKFATIPHGSTETNLRKNYYDMYMYMKPYNKSTVSEGIRSLKDNEINAFIYDATVLEYLAAHDEGCKLRTVGKWYAMTGYGVGFPKGSKWIDDVNKHLIQFQHDGEMERLQRFWFAGACKKGEDEGEKSVPLGILNFTSAFILLAGGMLLGGLLMLLEHIYFKFFRVKLRKWDRCGCCGLVSLSMGKSLTFEQSVREAMDMQRHYKCKNPICETQVWKLKHELDLALIKIERLQRAICGPGKKAVTKWKERGLPGPRRDERPPLAITDSGSGPGPPGEILALGPPENWHPDVVGGVPSLSEKPPQLGWAACVLPTEDPSAPPQAWGEESPVPLVPAPPYSGIADYAPLESGFPQEDVYNTATVPPTDFCEDVDSKPSPKPSSKKPSTNRHNGRTKGSKSLPNSPMKKSASGGDRPLYPSTYYAPGTATMEMEREGGGVPGGGRLQRTGSLSDSEEPRARAGAAGGAAPVRKTRANRGKVYMEVGPAEHGHVEKETVL